MSYKSRWFNKKEVQKIAKHFCISNADDLCDRYDTEHFAGGFGGNIENKLRLHPLTRNKEITEFMPRFDAT